MGLRVDNMLEWLVSPRPSKVRGQRDESVTSPTCAGKAVEPVTFGPEEQMNL